MRVLSENFSVVVNSEGQYSIWPADDKAPDGWNLEGVSGPKEHCLAHIEKVWTDMRPISLRTKMDAGRKGPSVVTPDQPTERWLSLPDRLLSGAHPVTIVLRGDTSRGIQECLDRRFVLLRIAGARGDTEIGLNLESSINRLPGQNSGSDDDSLELNGRLSIDYISMNCQAVIKRSSGEGVVRFSRLDEAKPDLAHLNVAQAVI